MFDLASGGDAAELPFIASTADQGQVGAGCELEKGRHRSDEAMVSLVALEPGHRTHQRRTRDLRSAVADGEGLRSVSDEPDPRRFDAEPPGEHVDLEAADRDQALGTAEQRAQGLPLRPADHSAQSAGVTARVEREDGRNLRTLGGAEHHGWQEIVHTLHVDEVVAAFSHFADERGRDVEVGAPRPGAVSPHRESSVVLHRVEVAAEIGGQDADLGTPRGNPACDLIDVRLDAAQIRGVTRAHHGDAHRVHRSLRRGREISAW